MLNLISWRLCLWSFWVNFCISSKVRVQLYSFAYRYPVFLKPFGKDRLHFPHCIVLALLSKIIWLYTYGLFPGYLFHWPIFMPGPHYLNCCCFVVCFEIRKCEASFFLKIILAIHHPLRFHTNFRNFFMQKKGYWDFDSDCIGPVDHKCRSQMYI